jgi:hypothetical protein
MVNAATLVTVPLLLNVVQSAELSTPRFVADAVGMFSVITGVVVPVATDDPTSVPVVPMVSAATLVTVPLLLKVFQSVDVKYPFALVVAEAMLIVAAPLVIATDTGAVPMTFDKVVFSSPMINPSLLIENTELSPDHDAVPLDAEVILP